MNHKKYSLYVVVLKFLKQFSFIESLVAQLLKTDMELDAILGQYIYQVLIDTLRILEQDYRMVQTFKGHEQRITALVVHEASQLCISGDYGGYIYAWSAASRENSAAPVASWQEHQDWRYSGVASLAISGDELLYSGSGDRTIKAWSTSVLHPFLPC